MQWQGACCTYIATEAIERAFGSMNSVKKANQGIHGKQKQCPSDSKELSTRPMKRTTDHMEHANGSIGQITSRIERIIDPMKLASDSMDLPKGPSKCINRIPAATKLDTSSTCKYAVFTFQA